MRKITIYPIRSSLSSFEKINADSKKLLDDLSSLLEDYQFVLEDDPSKLKDAEFPLILVQSGGSEGIFLQEIFPCFDGPYYLLTYGSCNSLAASLEILTFLKQHHRLAEVLHGDNEYILSRTKALQSKKKEEKNARLGVLGKPSDWLISSNVDYQRCQGIFHIDLIDIEGKEIEEAIKSSKAKESDLARFDYDEAEKEKSLCVYEGIKKIVDQYQLDGFTIRCFDILSSCHTSSCLGLALLNQNNVVASCEGDVPALLTAYLLQKKWGMHAFQANPQWIDPKNNTIDFAHCTLPLDMAERFELDTHFESGIGIGIHGQMKIGPVTVVKINAELTEFYCEEGELLLNEYRKDRCRTQIRIHMDSPVTYFLKESLGNHHQIVYGRKGKEISEYLSSFGLRRIKAS